MNAHELGRLDAIAQSRLVAAGEVSATELLEAALARIEEVNPRVNAVVRRFDERSRARAARAGGIAREGKRPLSGVPYLVKDLETHDAGIPCTSCSRALRDVVPERDSELIVRLKRAGLVICGRTASPELGCASTTESLLYGITRNPWDLERTPGGSSGGAAAAVAAGMVPAAQGSDGGGSIRTPASCCGLFGLKPSRGLVSPAPEADLLAGWSVQHALTRTVRDSAALLDAVAGASPGDLFAAVAPPEGFLAALDCEPGPLRIGIGLRPPSGGPLADACRQAAVSAGLLLESLGHDTLVLDPPIDWEWFTEIYMAIAGAAFTALLARVRRERRDRDFELEPLTLAFAEAGAEVSAADYLAKLGEMQEFSRRLAHELSAVDVWLTPTLTRPALELGELDLGACGGFDRHLQLEREWNPWSPLANCVGLPSATIPFTFVAGLPVGVTITGRYGADAMLFALSAQIEKAHPWAQHWPPVNSVGIGSS
jgi:amidase